MTGGVLRSLQMDTGSVLTNGPALGSPRCESTGSIFARRQRNEQQTSPQTGILHQHRPIATSPTPQNQAHQHPKLHAALAPCHQSQKCAAPSPRSTRPSISQNAPRTTQHLNQRPKQDPKTEPAPAPKLHPRPSSLQNAPAPTPNCTPPSTQLSI